MIKNIQTELKEKTAYSMFLLKKNCDQYDQPWNYIIIVLSNTPKTLLLNKFLDSKVATSTYI